MLSGDPVILSQTPEPPPVANFEEADLQASGDGASEELHSQAPTQASEESSGSDEPDSQERHPLRPVRTDAGTASLRMESVPFVLSIGTTGCNYFCTIICIYEKRLTIIKII